MVAPKYSHTDYQTYRPKTVPSKPRRTFTRNTFAEHNYNYEHSSKTNYPPQKTKNNHICSHYWDNPMTTTNSVNFRTNSHPPQDHSENYTFFQQNKNKKQAPHHTEYLSSDDVYLQPDIFAPYTQEYRKQGSRRLHTYKRIFSPNPTDTRNQQPIHMPNPTNTQSFQPIQPQNPMTMHSYQPTQMQNKIPLPYYLQQHEITKNHLSNFSEMPNAAESLQMTMNPYLPYLPLKESIDKNCPIHDQIYFSDSETTSNSSKRGKRRIKKQYKHKPVHLYNWNQPIRHIDSYILTVIKRKNEPHSK